MHAFLAGFVYFSLSCVVQVSGHAYVYWPVSRNRLKFSYLAQSQNSPSSAGGVSSEAGFNDFKSKHGAPPDGRGGARSDTAWAWNLCGMGPDPGNQKVSDSWKNWGGPPVTTYQQGGQITFTVVVNGEHGGAHEWRLCPKKLDGSMSVREAAECLDMYLIGRDCTPGKGCGCADDKCKQRTPHNDANDPLYNPDDPKGAIKNSSIPICSGNGDGSCVRTKPDFLAYGAHQFTYTLPKGVACEECTIQWYWATAFGEWFRNCIDVKIEGSGGGGGPAPAPAPGPSRRRSSSRRRGSRRRMKTRRRSFRRRGNRRRSARRRLPLRRRTARRRTGRVASAASPKQSRLVDLEYVDSGCFPLSDGDGAAEHLECDCDTGNGPRLYDTLRDYTCMHHKEGAKCRNGLPFYRLLVNKDESTRLCFSFCSAKGADLFGLLGMGNKSSPTAECRCGASVTNYDFWKTAGHQFTPSSPLPHSSLLLDPSRKLPDCPSTSVHVYSYEGWKRFSGSSGIQDALLDLGEDDKDYMMSIVKGGQVKGGGPVPAPAPVPVPNSGQPKKSHPKKRPVLKPAPVPVPVPPKAGPPSFWGL